MGNGGANLGLAKRPWLSRAAEQLSLSVGFRRSHIDFRKGSQAASASGVHRRGALLALASCASLGSLRAYGERSPEVLVLSCQKLELRFWGIGLRLCFGRLPKYGIDAPSLPTFPLEHPEHPEWMGHQRSVPPYAQRGGGHRMRRCAHVRSPGKTTACSPAATAFARGMDLTVQFAANGMRPALVLMLLGRVLESRVATSLRASTGPIASKLQPRTFSRPC